ncbi:PD40 domain-containing protein [Fimbriimonas ginsengisoli]|uniref:Uncharacterized protein n=1 Tax=Fimbriimonas ginsengisoli Gsoil 348 TaxID=661478 RepID=A0A068NP48_FIMGI|nr:PD40 domain-containing protein [Fimbriimonas ginsengisoli]AIE85216.1 hypothetical protein OP10G_1848 [Fimbriimonas ginsengisoli Gsoil 348]
MKSLLTILAGLALCAGMTGCRSYQADVSPDGRSVAVVTDKGVTIGPADGGKSRLVLKGAYDSPRYSPNGRFVAVHATKSKTVLIDPRTGQSTTLSTALEPPYAWRPDSSELLGWRAPGRASVLNVGKRIVVRGMDIPRPLDLVWFDDGSLALKYSGSVAYWHGGATKTIPTQLASVSALTGNSRSLVWMETTEGGGSDLPHEKSILRSYDLKTGAISTLRETPDIANLLGGKRYFCPTAFSISPDGDRLAFAGFEDLSPPGILDQLLAVQRSRVSDPKNRALKEKENSFLSQVRMRVVTATTSIRNGGFVEVAHSPTMGSSKKRLEPQWDWGCPNDIRWARNGQSISVAYTSGAQVLRLN